MSKFRKVLLVAGARPNFMKIAPLIKAIEAHNKEGNTRIHYKLVHTGQHYDSKMSGIFFRELGIPEPDINLEVGSGSHAVQTASVMKAFEPICTRESHDWVVVVGDVNSSLACTLVCAKLGIPVAHVEAGLRSFDRTMPEEVNRIVTDALSDLLLTPSEDANENLTREGADSSKVKMVGNIMIDALIANLERSSQSTILSELSLVDRDFAYVTLHRPSNVDDPIALPEIVEQLACLARTMPVVFPIHPRTLKMCESFGIRLNDCKGLRILDPIGYHDSLCLTANARLVLTDSGGLQEESTYFRTPCLTLRPNTERPITITVGSNRLTNLQSLTSDIENVLRSERRFGEVPPLWDGHTAERIVPLLADN